MAVTAKALHTSGTYLYYSPSGSSFEKLIDVKNIPALGSAPARIEVTDLSAKEYKQYIEGLKDLEEFTITANYTKTGYEKILALKDMYKFQVRIGENGENGAWEMEGSIDVMKNETAVDTAHEFSLTITPQNGIEYKSTVTFAEKG